jgi:hypothetical protein
MNETWQIQTTPLLRLQLKLEYAEDQVQRVRALVLAVRYQDDRLHYLTINGADITPNSKMFMYAEAFINNEWIAQ